MQGEQIPRPLVSESGSEWAGSDACRACHPAQHASWHDTWHRTMTQRVRPETVIGAFDGRATVRYRVHDAPIYSLGGRAAGDRPASGR